MPRSIFVGLVIALTTGCGLVADVPEDAAVPQSDVVVPCAPITDTGFPVKTAFEPGAPPELAVYAGAPELGLYRMEARTLYGPANDPSALVRKTLEILPNGELTSARADRDEHVQRVRYQATSGSFAKPTELRTMCGEPETFTFTLVPLGKTLVALVGRRGARTVVELYVPPPPL